MEKEKEEAIKQWTHDPCGAIYVEAHEEGSREFFEAALKYRHEIYAPWLKKLIEGLNIEGKKLLEIGCGMGLDLLCFAQKGAEVIGLDLTPKHIELARKLFGIYEFPVQLLIGDAESLDFKSNSVDVVYSFGVLHHTPHINKAISEIFRVLKPGGQAIVGLYHKNSWHYWVNLICIQGLLHKKLFRMSVNELLSSSVEFSRSGARPLVRVYSKTDCKLMFKDFASISIKKYHWQREQIPITKVRLFLPSFLPPFLGWYIVVYAKKGE